MRTLRGLALVATAAGVLQLACDDSVAPPVPGELVVLLQTSASDGAIVLRVAGPEPTEPAAANPAYVMHARPSGNELRAAVFGSLASGALLRFKVPDINRAGEYTATVLEVSDTGNQLRSDLSGYVVTVAKSTQ